MLQRTQLLISIALLAFYTLSTGSGVARDASGTAIAVVQATEVNGEAGLKPLQTEDAVFMGDQIKTGEMGEAQIIFLDQTRLVVGENSLVNVDSFVVN